MVGPCTSARPSSPRLGGLAAMGNPTAAAITNVLHNKQEFPLATAIDDVFVVFIGSGSSAGTTAAASATPSAGGWRTPIPPRLPLPAEMLCLTVEGVAELVITKPPLLCSASLIRCTCQ